MLYRSSSISSVNRRPGVVLLVVLALLALFASVGLSFVFYADAEAVAANLYKQSLVKDEPEVDPEVLAAYFLNQLLYPTNNPYSAMRGWDLARSMYGYNPDALNFTPYIGAGRDALSYPVAFPTGTVDNRFVTNHTRFDAAAGDPFLGMLRNPEFHGKTGDPNFRYVGGANPPWTAYDTNSLFLAQVLADGTVLMPSFYRPWIANSAPANSVAARYMSMSPESSWHPVFANFLAQFDADPDGLCHVRNLDFGPGRLMANGQLGNNDSRWMDMGFPTMTARNGKRYKALVAPLVMDLSNRLHLYAHGNRAGGTPLAPSHVSSGGLSGTEVNINLRIPGVSAVITPTGAVTVGAAATITTATPHGFFIGQKVVIAGVRGNGYNGVFTITAVPSATSLSYTGPGGLPPSGYGTVTNAEMQALFNYKYGGLTGSATSLATGTLISFPIDTVTPTPVRGGRWYSLLDFDSLGLVNPANGEQAVSSRPIFFSFGTTALTPGVAAGTNTMKVLETFGQSYGGFHWSIYPGMSLTIVDPPTQTETVTVISVDYAANTFVANFTKNHTGGQQVVFGTPSQGTPYFPGWGNVNAAEMTGSPMSLDLSNPLGANTAPQVSTMEALLRFGGSNSPALTAEIFRRMPTTLNNIRARNMYTTINWKLDRIGSVPVLAFDRNTPGNFVYNAALKYPQLVVYPPARPNYAAPSLLPNSDFSGTDWRSTLGNQLHVDLNRKLTDYPLPAVGGIINPSLQLTTAVTERQRFAKDIYDALVRVTGAQDPNAPGVTAAPASPDYMAARWLAQLAVNIVDYIDVEDYSTPFNWFGAEWVFGTELPRLVLNEVYAQQETAPQTRVNVWAELHNPFKTTPLGAVYPLDGGDAVLQLGNVAVANPPYKIEFHAASPAFTTAMRDPANNLGSAPAGAVALNTQTNWGGTLPLTTKVLPANSAASGGNIVIKTIAPDNAAAATAGASEAGGIVTIRTTTPHGFVVGQAVTITGVVNSVPPAIGPVAGYEGTFLITGTPSTTSFTYVGPAGGLPSAGDGTATAVSNANAGYYVIGPAGARYNSAVRHPKLPATYVSPGMVVTGNPKPIGPSPTGVSHVGADVTIQTTVAHGFAVGDKVVINGVAIPAYDNTAGNPFFIILSVPTPTSFTYSDPGLGVGTPDSGGGTATVLVQNVTLLLRRLANPNLPFSAVPGPNYNPYITVDYLDNIPVNQAVGVAQGRKQPYSASPTQVLPQFPGVSPPGQPVHTFFNQNNPLETPDWLVHLDRPLVNPLELLHVSAYKPHELTQQFKIGVTPFQHYVRWDDQANMLYRALEMFGTANHMAGTFNGGRHAGPINLNTMTEAEVFLGLADPQDANQPNPLFTSAQINALFNKVVASRNNNAAMVPVNEGNPFEPLSAGNRQKTIFRDDPTAASVPLFASGGTHPYRQAALIQKIYNNTTTTSNAFAVWWTVGYFEVVDESVKPVRLGAEIGRDQNRHVRQRFFAVVDRSGMELFRTTTGTAITVNTANALPQPMTVSYNAANVSVMGRTTAAWNTTQNYVSGDTVSQGPAAYFCIQANTGALPATSPAFWQPILQPGMLLEVGTPGATEVVAVKLVTGNTFTADFMMSHPANSPIVCRGNPGPQTAYSPRQDSNVVLHLSVIK